MRWDDYWDEEKVTSVIWWAGTVILAVLFALCMCGCRGVRYVPVESVRVEYKTRDSIRYDSIYRLDSVVIQAKGDTVYLEKYKYLNRYLFVNKTDTVLRCDTVEVPVPVERKLGKMEQMKIAAFDWIVLIVIIATFVWLIKKKARK